MVIDAFCLCAGLPKFLDPSPRSVQREDACLDAAVLVPILCDRQDPELLLTKRTEEVETHKGQISFPGGVADGRDAGPAATALRETEEEVGLPSDLVEVAGFLPELRTPTGFCIVPVVGIVRAVPLLTPNAPEVAEIFRVPLAFFLDDRHARAERMTVRGLQREVWFYEYAGRTIWGATAMIIRSLVERIRQCMEAQPSRETLFESPGS